MKRLAILCLLLTSCTADDNATKVLSSQGFTDIHLTGYRFYGCSKDDEFHTGFTAKGPTGKPVSGIVCSGWLKGATVRFD